MFLKTFIFFVLVNLVSDSYEQRNKKFFRKDYHFIEQLSSFYKIHAKQMSWSDAKRVCALEAATLFYPENEDEATAVLSYWRKTNPVIQHVWIGISDILIEGIFETVDGKSISQVYTNWNNGEPNNSGGEEDCVSLSLDNGKMNDYICREQDHFICKKSFNTLEWNHDCDMPNLDYTLNHDIQKCYKVHTIPLNWNEAYAICQLEQSSLALITNRRDAEYLVKLAEFTPKPRVKGNYQRGLYHLGFHDKLNEGWQTVKGIPMVVDADLWFENYQPEGNANAECGSMFYTGRLINNDCDMKSFFICEHEPGHKIPPSSISLTNLAQPLPPYIFLVALNKHGVIIYFVHVFFINLISSNSKR